MAKKKTTAPKQTFILQRDFDSSRFGKLKAGQSLELTDEQTIKILTQQKYINNDSK
jgi:hypothetical protein